jgi:hypothetical protein
MRRCSLAHGLDVEHAGRLFRAQHCPFIGDIREEASACFTGQLILAQDLQRYHLDREGRLQVVMGRLSQ